MHHNFIGTSPEGTAALGNGNDGISVINSSDNIIGGENSESRNIISAQFRNGITFNNAARNSIEGNLIGLDISGEVGIGNGRFGVTLLNSPDNIITNNTISGNGQNINAAGIDIAANGSTGNSVISNRIGTNISGTVAIGNQGPGILLFRSLSTTIGNGTAEGRNIISGNSEAGITISDSQTLGVNTTVRNNFIGVGADGSSALPNGNSGILISESNNNIIGGLNAADRNIISGNGLYGVELIGQASTENRIEGNFIGLNATGEAGIGNGGSGVSVSNAPANQLSGNVISHNGQLFNASGIEIFGSLATDNLIYSNKIGTNSAGLLPVPNNGIGLLIRSSNTTVGGNTTNEGNVISSNTLDGILITVAGGAEVSETTIKNNLIGVGADGIAPLGNNRDGIAIFGSSNNLIGGESALTPAFQNVIAFNGRNGISLELESGELPLSNGILGNSIFSNSARGIALGLASRVPSDEGDSDEGPNRIQNFPEIETIEYDDISQSFDLTYIVPSAPGNSVYPIRIEFFLSEGPTQGKTYLGFDTFEETDYQNFINNGVQKSISLSLLSTIVVPEQFSVTSTATDSEFNTSEFSDTASSSDPIAGVSYIVTNTNDSGAGSLRWAITEANNSTFRDTIRFDIAGSVPHKISIESQFVSFTNPVILDARSQPGYDLLSGIPAIVLDGSQAPEGTNALVFSVPTSGSAIKGFSVVGFQRLTTSPFLGGNAFMFFSDDNEVKGNYIGILPDGTLSPNTGDGIVLRIGSNNSIGAAGIENRNVISGNKVGINISDESAGNSIRNNLIGTMPSGENGAANSEDGILITSSSGNSIGGTEAGYRNVISGNTRNGITIQGSNATGNIIFGNYIGVNAKGSGGLGNGARGVFVFNSPENTISNNVISHNGQVSPAAGVDIFGEFGVSNQLLENQIGTNAGGSAALANNGTGVIIRTLNTTVIGNVISGNTTYGLSVASFQATAGNTLIEDNFIGVGSDGVTAMPNNFDGIFIDNSSGNIIGGTGSNSGNVISGNNRNGISIQGANSSANSVKGNFIGLDHTGTAKVANAFDGILLSGTAGNFIGGIDISERNTISGNTRYGIHVQGFDASGNDITGNYIGTDAAGLNGIGNGSFGVNIFNAPDNLVSANVVSHNGQSGSGGGIHLSGDGATANLVRSNKIGTDATGNTAIGNTGSGILVRTLDTIIGGSSPDDRNIVSGNTVHGIFLSTNIANSGNTTILNNFIGVGADGETPAGNGFDGINITGSSTNAIGEVSGQTAASPNVIAHNGRNGVTLQVLGETIPSSNSILGNSIFSNSFRGIDLGLSGKTANDADDIDTGPNKLQNFPVISNVDESIMGENLSLEITYAVPSPPTASAYPVRVEFFLSDGDTQGKTYLGYDIYSESDFDQEKIAVLDISSLSSIPGGTALVSTATDNDGNTSHFSDTTEFTGPPGVATLISPGNGDSEVTVSPTLIWSEVAGATAYRVQVSLTTDFTSTVIDESGVGVMELEVNNLDYETGYFWRVQASNNSGTGDWSSIFGFTTMLELITVTKTEIIGANGGVFINEASGVELTFPDGALSSDTEITFGIYNTIPEGVAISGLLVSLSGPDSEPLTFNEPVLIKVNYDPDNLPDGVTEENLKLLRYSELDEEWSELETNVDVFEKTASAFTPGFSGFGAGWIDGAELPPARVSLNTPANNATELPVNPTLSWSGADRADTYRLQLSASDDFNDVLVDESEILETEYEVNGLNYEVTYYWRARAVNESGVGEWSETRSFTTKDEPLNSPEVVTLSSPDDEAVDVSINPALNWQASADAASYTVQVSLTSDFTAPAADQSGVTDTELAVADLAYKTLHYWRVRAVNEAGQSDWSTVWSFTTATDVPETVTLISPGDGTDDVEISPLLVWEVSQGAQTYDLQLTVTPDFSEILIDLSDFENTEYQIDNELESATTHYWRVRAGNQSGYSEWSHALSFKTRLATSIFSEDLPKEFILNQNYPNPFNPATQIRFAIPEQAHVNLSVYNLLGQQVAMLVNENRTAGWHEVTFDASTLSTGVYMYRIESGKFVQTKKMLLMK